MRRLSHLELSERRLSPEESRSVERTPIYALLDNIRSLYNVGSIFRSSDGALLRMLYLTGYTPHPPRNEIDKTSLGAVNTVPWEYVENPLKAINSMKKLGVKICALEHTSASVPYHVIPADVFPICLVVGNELTGVSTEILQASDLAIEIPMYGTKQSLNVAVAYGVVLYELVRLWKGHSEIS